MAYGGDTVLAAAAPWEWWLFTNSPAQHGLVVVVVASILASVSSGRSHDVRGEWLSIMGYLLSGLRPHCHDLSWPGQGHWMRLVCEELPPGRDSHIVVGVIVRLSIKLDGIWAVLSQAW